MIVADNALISYLLIPGDFTGEAERCRTLDPDWIAPAFWISEFRNVLRNYVRADQMALEEALHHVRRGEMLMRGRTYPVPSAEVLTLAASSGCTAYDCEYVALAKARGVPLVTTDKEVLKAFPGIAVHPQAFGR